MNIGQYVRVLEKTPVHCFSDEFWRQIAGRTFALLDIDYTNREVKIDTTDFWPISKPLWVPIDSVTTSAQFSFFPEEEEAEASHRAASKKRDEIFKHIFAAETAPAPERKKTQSAEIDSILETWLNPTTFI